MLSKLKEYVKKDWKFLVITIGFMLLTLVIVTLNCSPGSNVIDINRPFQNAYTDISYFLIFIFCGFCAFLIRNADSSNVKLEKLYLCIAIPVGIVMSLCMPLGRVPDEDFHVRKAMAISQGNFFSVADENGFAKEKINIKVDQLVNRNINSYIDYWNRIQIPETGEKVEMEYNTMALYAPICHTPQAIGIFIARLFGGGIVAQCCAARLVNFAVSLTLIYYAIKLLPFKKHLLMYILLLPVTVMVLPTMSADALTISISSFYISYILYLRYDNNVEKLSKKDYIALTLSLIVVALCKIVYVPLCLLLVLIPKEKIGSLKKKSILVVSLMIVAIVLNLLWLVYCSRFLVEFNAGVNSKEQTLFILKHPIQYLIIFLRTVNFHFNTYYAGLSGDALGMFNVKAPEIFIYLTIVISAMLFLTKKEDEKIKVDLPTKIVAAIVFLSIIALIYTSVYVQWTPYKSTFIYGVQPRYFLPILILVALILDNDMIELKVKIDRFLLTFLLFFNISVAAATIYTYYFGILIDGYIK